ncbi:MAG TPA: FHA domain-containing protein [Kofleriaceae bacterium]|nr:FHA domain-containing protein [Kofleriaceae bacterium]
MAARVLWRDAQGHEGQVDLVAGEIKIGRAVECAIRSDDQMVSRTHARVFPDGGQWWIEDLGSANGVYYQEQRVTRHALKHGDAVRCGSLWLRFVDYQQQPQQGASARHPVVAPDGGGSGGVPQGLSAQIASQPNPQGGGGEADEEIRRLRRRVEQLQAELRVYRGGGKGVQMEELEQTVQALEEERNNLRGRLQEAERQLIEEGADRKVQAADAVREKAAEVVQQLTDLLSNMRINLTAAEGEFDQYSNAVPRASFELIREALRSSTTDIETARELLRALRRVAG